MTQLPDRVRLRREYERYRRRARMRLMTVLCKALAWPLTFLFLASWALNDSADQPSGFTFFAFLSLGAIGYFPMTLYYRLHYNAAKRRLDALPHIAFDDADTLPADEILVRGAEEPPVAQSEVLLRAAQKGQKTPKEELLRIAEE